MYVALGLQLLTPSHSASQRPRSMSWSRLFFFFFVSFKTIKKSNKQMGKTTTTITRDDGQGSTHVLVSVGHAAMETQGAARGGETCMRGRGPAATPSPRPATEDASACRSRGPGPPDSPALGRLSQERFLLPHGRRVGAPEAVFAALLPAHQTENPC